MPANEYQAITVFPVIRQPSKNGTMDLVLIEKSALISSMCDLGLVYPALAHDFECLRMIAEAHKPSMRDSIT